MKKFPIFFVFILFTASACFTPGMYAFTPIPTLDMNLIPTMVVQTAQALAALSVTPTGMAGQVTIVPAGTFAPVPTSAFIPTEKIAPVIGEAVVMLPVAVEQTRTPLTVEPTLESFLTAEIVPPTPVKPGCPIMNFAREAQVAELINAERARFGLVALTIQDQLVAAAQLHSADMACNNYFNHTALDGSSSGDRVTRTGYPWTAFGENIAAGYIVPEKLVQAWMKSPSHQANILNVYYAEMGVGYAYYPDSAYGIYWTVVFGKQ